MSSPLFKCFEDGLEWVSYQGEANEADLQRIGTQGTRRIRACFEPRHRVHHLAAKAALIASFPSAQQIEEQLFSASSILDRMDDAGTVRRSLRTLRMQPAGRHSPLASHPVLMGQPWTLSGRRA